MNKDKALEELFLAQKPHFDDNGIAHQTSRCCGVHQTVSGSNTPSLQDGDGGRLCGRHHWWCSRHGLSPFHTSPSPPLHLPHPIHPPSVVQRKLPHHRSHNPIPADECWSHQHRRQREGHHGYAPSSEGLT